MRKVALVLEQDLLDYDWPADMVPGVARSRDLEIVVLFQNAPDGHELTFAPVQEGKEEIGYGVPVRFEHPCLFAGILLVVLVVHHNSRQFCPK